MSGLKRLESLFQQGEFERIPPIDVYTTNGQTLISDGHHRSVMGLIYGQEVPRRLIQRASFPDIDDSVWQRRFVQPLIDDRLTLVHEGILTIADLYEHYQKQIYEELGLRRGALAAVERASYSIGAMEPSRVGL